MFSIKTINFYKEAIQFNTGKKDIILQSFDSVCGQGEEFFLYNNARKSFINNDLSAALKYLASMRNEINYYRVDAWQGLINYFMNKQEETFLFLIGSLDFPEIIVKELFTEPENFKILEKLTMPDYKEFNSSYDQKILKFYLFLTKNLQFIVDIEKRAEVIEINDQLRRPTFFSDNKIKIAKNIAIVHLLETFYLSYLDQYEGPELLNVFLNKPNKYSLSEDQLVKVRLYQLKLARKLFLDIKPLAEAEYEKLNNDSSFNCFNEDDFSTIIAWNRKGEVPAYLVEKYEDLLIYLREKTYRLQKIDVDFNENIDQFIADVNQKISRFN